MVAHLKEKGWIIEDVGVTTESDPDDTENMFHRVGLRIGSKIAEGEYERALAFCGTGMIIPDEIDDQFALRDYLRAGKVCIFDASGVLFERVQ